MFECSPKKFYRLKLPLKNGGDDRDDGRRGDESKGEPYNPLGGLSIFNKFLVEFFGISDGSLSLCAKRFYVGR